MKPIETKRLILREWREDKDLDPVVAYFSDASAVRFLGGVKEREAVWRLLASYIGHYHMLGYSYWAVEEKESGDLAGAVGIWNSAYWPEPELGYWFLTNKQGRGYATESASACLEHALDEIGLGSLVSYIHSENSPSIHVAQKLGAFHDGQCDLLHFGVHDIYRYK